MKRREFIWVTGASTVSIAWPLFAHALPPASVARIGLLSPGSAFGLAKSIEAFRAGLHDLGYVEGKQFVIEFRFAEGDVDRLPDLAAELVRLNVDVIVTNGPGTLAVKSVTSTVPIVMAVMGDAVATGVIASLAHPGGNITGSAVFYPEIMAKRLEMLKEAVPSLTQAAVLMFPDFAPEGPSFRAMEATGKNLKVRVESFEARRPSEFENAFAAMAAKQIGAVVIGDHPLFVRDAPMLAALAAKQRLASIGSVEFASAGGLMAYGVNFQDLYRRAAYFVDKILNGVKPSDLPVEQPTKLHSVINLKTAKELGLSIPSMLLVRANEVIE